MGNSQAKVNDPDIQDIINMVPLDGTLVSKKNINNETVRFRFDPSTHMSILQNNMCILHEEELFVDFQMDTGTNISLGFHRVALAAVSRHMRDLMTETMLNQVDEFHRPDLPAKNMAELQDVVYGKIALCDITDETRVLAGIPDSFETPQLLKAFHSLYKDEELTNLHLLIGGDMIKCHREILASSSPRLYHLLRQMDAEMSENEIVSAIEFHEDVDIIHNILDYLYSCQIEIDTHNCQQLLHAAVTYQLPDLVNACLQYMAPTISPENAIGMRYRLK